MKNRRTRIFIKAIAVCISLALISFTLPVYHNGMAVKGLWNLFGINLPDFGISEKLGIGPRNMATEPGAAQFNAPFGLNPTAQQSALISSQENPPELKTYSQVLSERANNPMNTGGGVGNVPYGPALPPTFQQPTPQAQSDPYGSVLGAGTGAATPTTDINLTIPTLPTAATGGEAGAGYDDAAARKMAEDAEIARLTPLYEQARQGIGKQGDLLDTGYTQGRTDIEGRLLDTEGTATRRKGELEESYGGLLQQAKDKYGSLRGTAVNTYNDIARRLQDTFSSLGTLDSSAFGEQQFRAGQNVANEITGIGKQSLAEEASIGSEKRSKMADVDDTYNAYKRDAESTLSDLALQYQSGKNQIADALAQNDLNGAAAIQEALNALKERAQTIQDDIRTKTSDFVNQAALLQAQGMNVNTNLGNINSTDFATRLSDAMSKAQSGVYQRLAGINVPGAGSTSPAQNAQGFIAPDGQSYGSYSDYLRALLSGGGQ